VVTAEDAGAVSHNISHEPKGFKKVAVGADGEGLSIAASEGVGMFGTQHPRAVGDDVGQQAQRLSVAA
jgi:hypothetical protein